MPFDGDGLNNHAYVARMKMSSSRTLFLGITFNVCIQLLLCFVAQAQTYYNSGTGWGPVGKAPVDVRWSGPGTYSNVAKTADFAGTYADTKFLQGQAYFQLGIQPAGNSVLIVFNAAHHDGHGVATEGRGSAKAISKDKLEFQFTDSCRISGSGTITRAGNDVRVDFIFATAADKRYLEFYGRKMLLRRVAKK